MEKIDKLVPLKNRYNNSTDYYKIHKNKDKQIRQTSINKYMKILFKSLNRKKEGLSD